MARLVVPGALRMTLKGINNKVNRAVDIVIDVTINSEGFESRNEAIADTVQRTAHHWQDDVLPGSQNDYVFQGTQWLDLDTADGGGGFLPADTGHQTVGSVTGDSASPQVSVLLTKPLRSPQRGLKNGRTYWGPVVQAALSEAGALSSGYIADRQPMWDDFFDGIFVEDGTPPDIQFTYPAVVHITARDEQGHPTAGVAHRHNKWVMQSIAATQRRRLRG